MEQEITITARTKSRRRKMKFRRMLTRKLAIITTVIVMTVMVIMLLAGPVGALNKSPDQRGFGEVLNQPAPMPNTSLPPEIMSTVVAIFAKTAGAL